MPEGTEQKVQFLVQMFPRTITVAVRRDQHSPILGHWALWQTVCSSRLAITSLVNVKSVPDAHGRRSHEGNLADTYKNTSRKGIAKNDLGQPKVAKCEYSTTVKRGHMLGNGLDCKTLNSIMLKNALDK